MGEDIALEGPKAYLHRRNRNLDTLMKFARTCRVESILSHYVKTIINVSASMLARLKNISEEEHLDYNFLLLRYMQERFLARLAVSNYVKKFVLKGGFLLMGYNVSSNRKQFENLFNSFVLRLWRLRRHRSGRVQKAFIGELVV